MNKIIKKRMLAENVFEYVIDAADAVKNARAGQFVIIRTDEDGERIPLTICDYDKKAGTLTLLVQTVGYTTARLQAIPEGGFIHDVTGPLGNPTDLSFAKKIMLVGGGIGTAVILPQSKELFDAGKEAYAILGARDKGLLMYEEEFEAHCRKVFIMTDNGSKGEKGFVTAKLKELLDAGERYDAVLAVGPLMMMKAVCDVTRPFGVKTLVSMNSVMVDGTGMCGSCRLTVNGVIKYACVDGPEFDGHQVDFDEAVLRSRIYTEEEKEAKCRIRG